MNKEQQIEEIAKDINNTWFVKSNGDICGTNVKLKKNDIKMIAHQLVLEGYRKLPEDSVVLSREEQEKILTATEKRIKELKKQILQARKETAEKILTELLDFVNGWFEGVENNDFGVEFNRISKNFAKTIRCGNKGVGL